MTVFHAVNVRPHNLPLDCFNCSVVLFRLLAIRRLSQVVLLESADKLAVAVYRVEGRTILAGFSVS